MKLYHIMHVHLKAHCADLIVKYEWLPNSPDFNHSTTNVCGAILQTFYKLNLKPKTILELKVHCSRYGMTCCRLSQVITSSSSRNI